MYGGSILFLGYVYTYLLRTRATKKTPPGQSQKKKHRKRKVSVDKVSSNTGSFYLRLGAVGKCGHCQYKNQLCNNLNEIQTYQILKHHVFLEKKIILSLELWIIYNEFRSEFLTLNKLIVLQWFVMNVLSWKLVLEWLNWDVLHGWWLAIVGFNIFIYLGMVLSGQRPICVSTVCFFDYTFLYCCFCCHQRLGLVPWFTADYSLGTTLRWKY